MSATVMSTEETFDVGSVEQIPLGEGRLVQVGHVPLAVFRTREGQVYATQSRCTHKAGPLAEGLIGGGTLVCPLHEYKCELATGRSIDGFCKDIKTYPVTVNEAGHILVSLKPNPASPAP